MMTESLQFPSVISPSPSLFKIEFASDGTLYGLSAGGGKAAGLYKLKVGAKSFRVLDEFAIKGHKTKCSLREYFSSLAVSRENPDVLAVTEGSKLRLYLGKQQKTLSLGGRVKGVMAALSPDDSLVALAFGKSRDVEIVELTDGFPRRTIEDLRCENLAFSKDKELMFASPGKIGFCNLDSNKIRTIKLGKSFPTETGDSQTSNLVVAPNGAAVWNGIKGYWALSPEKDRTVEEDSNNYRRVALARDGRFFVVSSYDTKIRIFTPKGRRIKTVERDWSNAPTWVCVGPDHWIAATTDLGVEFHRVDLKDPSRRVK